MEKKLVFLVYQTDAWHTVKTRELFTLVRIWRRLFV
jgi:hypothetical protein